MKLAVRTGLAATVLPLVSAICHHGTTLYSRSEPAAPFGFDGLAGPLNWFALDKAINWRCALGRQQSPINVVTSRIPAVPGSVLALNLTAVPGGAELENLGTTVEVPALGGGTIVRDGLEYSLVQFHFHTPSEHRIDDEYFPLEVHFVFQTPQGNTTVLGVPIELCGTTDPLLAAVFQSIESIPARGNVTHTGALDFAGLAAHVAASEVFQYSGSLTTPPCTETIAWNVVRQPLGIDWALFLKTKRVLKFNSRYTQNAPGEVNLLDNARNELNGFEPPAL